MSSQAPATTVTSHQPTSAAEDERWKEWKEWKKRKQWEDFCRWKEEEGRNNANIVQETSGTTSSTGVTNAQYAQSGQATGVAMDTVTPLSDGEQGNNDLNPVQKESEDTSNTGKTQYVLSGQPTGWAAMDKVIHEYDENKVKECKDDIDNLLVFAGLFSSILTAFLIQSYQSLLGDTSGQSQLGQQPVNQTAGYQLERSQIYPATSPSSPSTPTQPSTYNIRVNALWFASLILALISASFGILVKQWLREYMAVTNPSPQARLRLRQLRCPALDTWMVFGIAAILPFILHLSLALFFVGLAYFTAPIHPSIRDTTIPLIGAWGFCFAAVTLLPLFFPRCPYRTTFLQLLFSRIHRGMQRFTTHASHRIDERLEDTKPPASNVTTPTPPPSSVASATPPSSGITSTVPSSSLNKTGHWYSPVTTLCLMMLRKLFNVVARACDRANELEVILSDQKDLKVLSDADAIQSNDELLITEISEAAGQVDIAKLNPYATLKFIRELLRNRISFPSLPDDDDNNPYAYNELIINLEGTTLRHQTRKAIIKMILNFLPRLPSSFKGFPDPALIRGQGQPNDPAHLEPRLIFALLLSLSGESLDQAKFLVDHLSQQKRGREIVLMFRPYSLKYTTATWFAWKKIKVVVGLLRGLYWVHVRIFHRSSSKHITAHRRPPRQDKTLANLVHGLCLVHRSVQGQWSLAQVLRSIGPTQEEYPTIPQHNVNSDNKTTSINPETREKVDTSKYLESLGFRTMCFVTSLEYWTGGLDRAVIEDVLTSICDGIKTRITVYKEASGSASSLEPGHIAGSTVEKVDVMALDNIVTFLCLQTLRPQWFRPEKCWSSLIPSLLSTHESRNITLARAVSCVPVLGALRLCWRAATHSHVSGVHIIKGLDVEMLKNWKISLQNAFNGFARSNDTYTLKLLSFSLYLYVFSTPRLLGISQGDGEKEAWKAVFGELATALQGSNVQSEGRTPRNNPIERRSEKPLVLSALASICLEIIRFEETLARILHQHIVVDGTTLESYSNFRYTPNQMVDKTLISGWDCAPLCSVFPETLISTLKPLAASSYTQPISELDQLSGATEINFHEYCIAYGERLRVHRVRSVLLLAFSASEKTTTMPAEGHATPRNFFRFPHRAAQFGHAEYILLH
ncbi:hypothetical protein BDY19DRAFT_993133 [Irpex rosettiformis]|uniref:Uncharacterized protein n=1 Tax=Irpex rosettiformis TaxID=378272 RepID=A0ACB8U5L1_9APHY|nr:hypothetical protein BDY19DRAFT_993133 [Irpex rosettiformis]